MLFTDGGEDRAQDIFEQYNWPNKTVSDVLHRNVQDLPQSRSRELMVSHTCGASVILNLEARVQFIT